MEHSAHLRMTAILDCGFKKQGKALTGMQALSHGGGLDQVAFTHITGDEVVELID